MARLDIDATPVAKGAGYLLWQFLQREWRSIFTSGGFGIALAALARLMLQDHAFRQFVLSQYAPPSTRFDDPRAYVPHALLFLVLIILAAVLRIPNIFSRALRSWWEGVTSGLALVTFVSTFLLMMLPFSSLKWRSVAVLVFVVAGFFVSSGLYIKSLKRGPLSEDDLRVSEQNRQTQKTPFTESDDPIQTWDEDALGRASLVDSMSAKIMISKSPVLALFGEFGSGKTSILNLLREHLSDKAILVNFSTWLPGSQETLTNYLLSDIATECHKLYVVPGLRKSAKRLATALGQNVPFLKSYLGLLPPDTQRDDIESLQSALSRLPKRVVVLLDELDRMEKDELSTLLKVIRGVASLRNVSFVCAFDRPTVEKILEKESSYFEKFFQTSIQIPAVDPTALRKAGTERLTGAFRRRNWFGSEQETQAFRTEIEAIWDDRIAPFCRNLRAIGLLANDVGAAAALLHGEVYPLDLTLLELLRRFKPEVYKIIGKNSVVLTGGPGVLRGGPYHTDDEIKDLAKNLIADLQKAAPDNEEFLLVKGALRELFPLFQEPDTGSWRSHLEGYRRERGSQSDDESSKRVRNPDIFPAYFRYELPEAMFSSMELTSFLKRMDDAVRGGLGERIFHEMLASMERGSAQRDDFLRKLAEAAQKSIPLTTAKVLAHAAVTAADKYTYDVLAAFGEAGHVLRIVLRVAQRLSLSERLSLLEDSIFNASDDTMAFNILTKLTAKESGADLEVSLAQLYPAFTKRMKNRYGREVDATNIDLTTSDPWAFNYWGHDLTPQGIPFDAENRAIQHDFWPRYIGNNRSRLATAFRRFLLPVAIYSEDPTSMVENKISVADLRRLYEELPEDPNLNKDDRVSLRTLRRFLDGEFKNGVHPVNPNGLYNDEEEEAEGTTA
jgi:predicted KAP-like P-loop ATPase